MTNPNSKHYPRPSSKKEWFHNGKCEAGKQKGKKEAGGGRKEGKKRKKKEGEMEGGEQGGKEEAKILIRS